MITTTSATNPKHTLLFPTARLLAIFKCEILGQISDGVWENTAPNDHYKFWHRLELGVSPTKTWEFIKGTVYSYPTKRTGYNLTTLTDPNMVDLSARMRSYVVDAIFNLGLGERIDSFINDAEGRALTIDEYNLLDSKGYGYLEEAFFMVSAYPGGPEEFLKKINYGMSIYSRKDLIKDLREIKREMKAVLGVFFHF